MIHILPYGEINDNFHCVPFFHSALLESSDRHLRINIINNSSMKLILINIIREGKKHNKCVQYRNQTDFDWRSGKENTTRCVFDYTNLAETHV